MSFRISRDQCRDSRLALQKEWILPNHIGGYAMGTVSGANTRRYHGLLIAATRPPATRMLLVSNLDFSVEADGVESLLSTNVYPGAIHPSGFMNLNSFELSSVARWTYEVAGFTITKTVEVVRGTNHTKVAFETSSETPIRLKCRPLIAFRDHHGTFARSDSFPECIVTAHDETRVRSGEIELEISHPEAEVTDVEDWYYRQFHEREAERGLSTTDDCFCPIQLEYELSASKSANLSFRQGDFVPSDYSPGKAMNPDLGDQIKDSAALFLVHSADRTSMIAGYPWFSDWGRDTMIALPGYVAATQEHGYARQVLADFARYLDQGMLPNRFPETDQEPEYNTVDATLWWANAAHFTLSRSWDEAFAVLANKVLDEIIVAHVAGTRYEIRVDLVDGLVSQGSPETQLTWMDARVDGTAITPRNGKPIEINALWLNLLKCQEWICQQLSLEFSHHELRQLCEASLYARFPCASSGGLFDTLDPDDSSIRPNQVIALSLPFVDFPRPVGLAALEVVDKELLTPYGLRTLAASDPRYCGRFEGDMRNRDAAYHMGTVWPWLLGSYFTACLRYREDPKTVRKQIRAIQPALSEYGLGGIAEVYDGDAPHNPGGCPWQAWSACEIARVWFDELPKRANKSAL